METKNIMIVGVGGQGSLLASKLLGKLLVSEGFDVKVSEVHGMSQRGGSVVTYVRFGDKVYSPIITDGEADFIVSFEKIEAARWLPCLKKGGTIVVNTQQIDIFKQHARTARYDNRRLVCRKLLTERLFARLKVIRVNHTDSVDTDCAAKRLKVNFSCRVALYVIPCCGILLMSRHTWYGIVKYDNG